MGYFLEQEKKRQTEFKLASAYFTNEARAEGIYRGRPRPFCLPAERAEENLYHGIREQALDYFARQSIAWHQGKDGRPNNHLCSSQVCCLNFLFPFADKPHALASLLRPLFPGIRRMIPMEKDNPDQFVSVEWIGLENYLQEKMRRGAERTRGANFTSADAAVMFEGADGLRHIVLVEWKYTESYSGSPLHVSSSGTSRVNIYRPLYEKVDCPLNKSILGDFGHLFYEPFYQLMRQQFLAWQMEQARELGADVVSILHISPARNKDFHQVTSPGLRHQGDSAIDIWKTLVHPPDRFRSISIEELFGGFPAKDFPDLDEWWGYINQRYSWLSEE